MAARRRKPEAPPVRVDRREDLVWMRDQLRDAIEAPDSTASVAACVKQLRDVNAEIEAIDREKPEVSVVDEVAERRRERRRKAAEG